MVAAVARKAVRKRLRKVKKSDVVLADRKDRENLLPGQRELRMDFCQDVGQNVSGAIDTAGYQWLLVVTRYPENAADERRALRGNANAEEPVA